MGVVASAASTVRPGLAALSHPRLWRGADLAHAAGQAVLGSGFELLDAELPGGGWPVGALTELMPAHEGIGELRLLGPALARLTSPTPVKARATTLPRRVVWIAPPHQPYAPALAAAGIDLAQLLVVNVAPGRDALWAAEQALASRACGAVLVWPGLKRDAPRYADLRRLTLAAEGSHAAAFVFRPQSALPEPSPAVLRISLDAQAGGLSLRIGKRRGAPAVHPVLLTAFAQGRAGTVPVAPLQNPEPRQAKALPHVLDRIAAAASAAGTVQPWVATG
jgi:hypothetical protein